MVRFRVVVFSLALLVSACGQSNQNINNNPMPLNKHRNSDWQLQKSYPQGINTKV
jgi:hypothetical protein